MSRLILILINIFFAAQTFAQLQQPNRYEIPLNDEEPVNHNVIPCDKLGLVIWRQHDIESSDNMVQVELTALDTTFAVNWKRVVSISSDLNFISAKYQKGKLHFLYGNYTSKVRNLELIQVDFSTGLVQNHTIKNIIPFAFFEMETTDNAIVIGGYYNYRPLVILFDFEERVPRILPGLFNDKSEMVQMKVNESGTIDVVLSGKNNEKINTLFIHTFDSQARLINMIELQATKRKALLFGRSKSLSFQSQIVAGVYGRRNSDYSRGVFIANINEFGQQKIKYYNYAEFENFFSYMRAKREQRVKRRIERKKIKNKKIRFNYRLLVHQLIEHEGQYILLGEAFYPKYKTIPGSSGVFNSVWTVNRGMYSYDRIFEGYQYTHAVVMGFDQEGNVLWDNSFEIRDVLSKNLDQFVHASIAKNKVNLLYVFDNSIRTKVVSGNEVIEGEELVDVKLSYDDDETGKDDTDLDGLQRWYDDVFVTYGIQSIKNLQQQGVKLNREVFFVNKVVAN